MSMFNGLVAIHVSIVVHKGTYVDKDETQFAWCWVLFCVLIPLVSLTSLVERLDRSLVGGHRIYWPGVSGFATLDISNTDNHASICGVDWGGCCVGSSLSIGGSDRHMEGSFC